jgi:hypothetical protein
MAQRQTFVDDRSVGRHCLMLLRAGKSMLKLDIGCGNIKRDGFVGVDATGNPDCVCDIANDRLPFDDKNAEYIYSSHCLEHIERDRLFHVFQEITRVSAHGAVLEFWHPHWSHSDAFIFGHLNYIGEGNYLHLGCVHRDFWSPMLGAQWILEEVRYGLEPHVLADMAHANVDIEFAVKYYRDVIGEIGVFLRINRAEPNSTLRYRRAVSSYRDRTSILKQLSDGPQYHGAVA